MDIAVNTKPHTDYFSGSLLFNVSSIHPSSTAYPLLGSRGGWSLSQHLSGERRGTPWTGRQSIAGQTHRDRQPFTLTVTPMVNLEYPISLVPILHVFGLWEEAGVPGENPRLHGENMQTPHRKIPRPSRDSNLEPSCCEATALTTAPPCRPKQIINLFNQLFFTLA